MGPAFAPRSLRELADELLSNIASPALIIDSLGYLRGWKGKPYTGYANMSYMQIWVTALILRDAIGSVNAAATRKGSARS